MWKMKEVEIDGEKKKRGGVDLGGGGFTCVMDVVKALCLVNPLESFTPSVNDVSRLDASA